MKADLGRGRGKPAWQAYTMACWAALCQLALLGAWLLHNHQAAQLTFVGLSAALAYYVTDQPQAWPHRRLLRCFAHPRTRHVAYGGLGMLLGAWVEAHFAIPPCMCCRWSAQTPLAVLIGEQARSVSNLGMIFGCLVGLAMDRRWAADRAQRDGLFMCSLELMGMMLGMLAMVLPCIEALRHVTFGKLELGHGAMLVGMALGSATSRAMATLVLPQVCQPYTPEA